MPIVPINLGTAPLGTDGDTAREAFTKVNENFSDLDSRLDGEGGLSERVDQNEQDIEALDERVTDNENILALLTDPDIPHPTLALLFDSGLAIDPRITFTRASQATYVDAMGRIRTAANNVPRLDYDPVTGVCKGLLMERAATNLVEHSGDPAQWSFAGGSTGSPLPQAGIFYPVRVATGGQFNARATATQAAVSEGGSLTAHFFYEAGTSGAARVVVRNSAAGVDSVVSGAIGSLAPSADAAGPIDVVSDSEYGRGGVRRLVVRFTANSAGAGVIGVGIGPNSGTAGEDIIVYGAQLETGTTATSYIPTTGSPATRTADSAVITDLSGWMRTDQGTFVVSHDADAGRVLLSSGANELLESQGAGTIAVAYDASGSSVSYNGGAAVAGPALSFDTALRLFASASEVMGAHGAKVLYFPVPLTPAQLQALTS